MRHLRPKTVSVLKCSATQYSIYLHHRIILLETLSLFSPPVLFSTLHISIHDVTFFSLSLSLSLSLFFLYSHLFFGVSSSSIVVRQKSISQATDQPPAATLTGHPPSTVRHSRSCRDSTPYIVPRQQIATTKQTQLGFDITTSSHSWPCLKITIRFETRPISQISGAGPSSPSNQLETIKDQALFLLPVILQGPQSRDN